jgi:hypothetical protein
MGEREQRLESKVKTKDVLKKKVVKKWVRNLTATPPPPQDPYDEPTAIFPISSHLIYLQKSLTSHPKPP